MPEQPVQGVYSVVKINQLLVDEKPKDVIKVLVSIKLNIFLWPGKEKLHIRYAEIGSFVNIWSCWQPPGSIAIIKQ